MLYTQRLTSTQLLSLFSCSFLFFYIWCNWPAQMSSSLSFSFFLFWCNDFFTCARPIPVSSSLLICVFVLFLFIGVFTRWNDRAYCSCSKARIGVDFCISACICITFSPFFPSGATAPTTRAKRCLLMSTSVFMYVMLWIIFFWLFFFGC